MEMVDLPLAGLKLLKPKVFRDARGFFVESYKEDLSTAALDGVRFVQDNHSRSQHGTIRGMHFQSRPGQAKLVRVGRGRIFDVAVDIRKSSPTFGRWHGEILDDEALHMLFIPVGFAHGFCVLSTDADVHYKCSSGYDAATESGFLFDDPAVGIQWPVDAAAVVRSQRDTDALPLARLPRELLSP